jgi:hypothetical protein
MSFWAGFLAGVAAVYAVSAGVAIGVGVYLSRRTDKESLFDYGLLSGDEITIEGFYDDTADVGVITKNYSEYFNQS